MKFVSPCAILLLLLAAACGQQQGGDQHHHGKGEDDAAVSGNEALYNEVMAVHDEVMPEMDRIYKSKMALKKRLESGASVTDAERQEIHQTIALLDSASEGMMVWMRRFDPVPDSEGEEKARDYLTAEMKKITKVKEDMLRALQQAEKFQ